MRQYVEFVVDQSIIPQVLWLCIQLRALASLFPAATHSCFVTPPEWAACHPRAHLPSHSRVQLRHHRARALQPANRTRRVAQAMRRQQPLLHHLLVAPPLRLSLPLRPYRALRMYAACPCLHAVQLPLVAANAARQHQVLSLLHQQAVLRSQGHNKCSRVIAGSCVRALARKYYRSLTARTNAQPRSGQPVPYGSLKASEREDSVGLFSPPSS